MPPVPPPPSSTSGGLRAFVLPMVLVSGAVFGAAYAAWAWTRVEVPAVEGAYPSVERARLAASGARDALVPAADALHLGRRLLYAEGEPFLANLVGVSIVAAQVEALLADRKRLLARARPELAAFLADLHGMDPLERPLGRLLVGERDAEVGMWAGGRDGAADAKRKSSAFEKAVFAVLGPMIAPDLRVYADRAIELHEGRRFGEYRAYAASLREDASLYQWVLHPAGASARMLAGLMLTMSNAESAMRVLDTEARFDALRVAIAAELHRRDHGAAPASLAALVPAYLPASPADPYRPAAALRYAGGRLWSVAWDGQDQGGQAVLRPVAKGKGQRKRLDRAAPGDLVLLPPESFPPR